MRFATTTAAFAAILGATPALADLPTTCVDAGGNNF